MKATDHQDEPRVPQLGEAELAAGLHAVLSDVSSMDPRRHERLRAEAEFAEVDYAHALRAQRGRRVLAGVAATVVLVLGGLGWRAIGHDQQAHPQRPSGSSGTYTPGMVVSVGYSKVAGVRNAETVASMFTQFFSAINDSEYDTALGFYDPDTSVVDLRSSASREHWKEAMTGTRYDDVEVDLNALTVSGQYTYASVEFRSTQAPRYGPPSDVPRSSCAYWTATYQLTHADGVYRISKAHGTSMTSIDCMDSG